MAEPELIGADSRFEVTGSEPGGGVVVVDIEVASTGFDGFSRFAFDVAGDRVRSMTIVA